MTFELKNNPNASTSKEDKEYWLASYTREYDDFGYIGSVGSWTMALYVLSVVTAAPILAVFNNKNEVLAIRYKDQEVKILFDGDSMIGLDRFSALKETPLNSWAIQHGGSNIYQGDSQEEILKQAPALVSYIKPNLPVYIRQRGNADLYWLLLHNGQVIDYTTGETKAAAPDGSSQADLFELTHSGTGAKSYYATLKDCSNVASYWHEGNGTSPLGVISKKGYMIGGYIKSYLVWPGGKITSALSGKTVDITAS